MKIFLILAFLLCSAALARAETVSLASLQGLKNPVSLQEQKGKLLVYFWASWCPDCRDKFKTGALTNLQAEFPQAKVITVNSDRDEAKGASFVEEEKISLPVFRDKDKALSKSLKLFAIPSWAVLERNKSSEWEIVKSSTGSEIETIEKQLRL
jgi:thiol-disulfide isomerase/thioredoxin